MKKLIISLGLLIYGIVYAQVPTFVPFVAPPAAATDINNYEFYIDSVTTSSLQAVSFTAAATNSITGQSINLSTVPSGVHQLYAKVININGNASIFAIGNFYKEGPGFEFAAAPAAPANLTSYKFYIDSVTAVSEQPVTFTPATTNSITGQSINLSTVPSGVHQLYAKVINTDGNESIFAVGNFYKEGPGFEFAAAPATASNIESYGFFIDSVGVSNKQSLPFTPASTNSSNGATINLAGVFSGVHQLYVQVYDVAGKASIVNVGNFSMTANYEFPAIPAAAPPVSDLEYYIDNDPGFGLASPITVPSNSGNINLVTQSITIPTTLSIGQHTLHIRSKQNPWSIESVSLFDVTNSLPVIWQNISAQLQANNSHISWSTASESNSHIFEIEWSTNGLQFSKIGTVNAAGSSSVQQQYSFIHYNIANGFNYYRIKQIDLNGNFKYSTIVKVLYNNKLQQIIIAPNPVADVLNVVLPKSTYVKSLTILDAIGQPILRKIVNSDMQYLSVPVSNVAKGKYTLLVEDKKETNTISFVKN